MFDAFSDVSNLFEPLVDQHYKVLSDVMDVFSKVSNLFESLVDKNCKVLLHEFDVFWKFPISSKH